MSSGKGTTHLLPIYQTHEGVSGTVEIVLAPGKKLEHLGIKIELVGAIEVRREVGREGRREESVLEDNL